MRKQKLSFDWVAAISLIQSVFSKMAEALGFEQLTLFQVNPISVSTEQWIVYASEETRSLTMSLEISSIT